MNKNKNSLRKKISSSTHYNLLAEEPEELGKEDRELYLFLRGGFASK